MTRRDLLLRQMGITEWVLRRPTVLQGEVAVTLTPQIRLVLISATLVMPDTPLFRDILQAFNLTVAQICCLTPQQYGMLSASAPFLVWYAGLDDTVQAQAADIKTPDLQQLANNPESKRNLWQQICNHEADFFPDAGRFGRRVTN